MRIRLHILALCLISASLLFVKTAVADNKMSISKNERLEVSYASNTWNKDSSKIDTANIFVKDAESGKVVKILLEETAPDSATFTGSFSLGWTSIDKIKPQVFIPPENVRGNDKALSQFTQKVRNSEAKRKPIVFKKLKDHKSLDVYDTVDQAKQAFSIYKKEKKEEAKVEKHKLVEPVAEQSETEAQILMKKQEYIAMLAKEALKREQERLRQEQLERQKIVERLQQQEKLQEQERTRRKNKAKELSAQALQEYRQGNYLKAESLFKKSIELDPNDTSYYFRYGVTLYRNNRFNEALVTLKLANVDASTQVEKNYYMGLIHMKLKEVDFAIENFQKVRAANHEILSPSAAFYIGLIYFEQEKFNEAKAPFEYVLDTSKDPRLDEKAESYLEKIANALLFKRKQQKKHDLTLLGGVTYDSNVLFASDSNTSQGSTSDKAGFRLLGIAYYDYRLMYERTYDFSLSLDALYYWSLNRDDHKAADPLLVTATAPYTYKGLWNGKGYKLTFEPGYESLSMDPEGTGEFGVILSSILFNVDSTLIMNEDWFANYYLEARQDDSQLASSIGDNDSDALRIEIGTEHNFFKDKSKKTALSSNAAVILNQASGSEKLFQRFDFGFGYTRPFQKWKDASWNLSLDYYYLTYPDSDESREDQNTTLTYTVSKPVNTWWSWGITSDYSVNNSNDSDYQYSKYTVLFNVSMNVDEWYESK